MVVDVIEDSVAVELLVVTVAVIEAVVVDVVVLAQSGPLPWKLLTKS